MEIPMLSMLNALAAGSSSLRTSKGIMALRAGPLMPCAPLWIATRRNRIQTLFSWNHAWSARATLQAHKTRDATMATFRRS